jgi:hypothetical protein
MTSLTLSKRDLDPGFNRFCVADEIRTWSIARQIVAARYGGIGI